MKDQASNDAKAFSVQVDSEILRRIRQHARSSMNAEICGILIGSKKDDAVVVEACIPGEKAAQGGAHVTFTQDTWAHIYKVKDKDYPDKNIVGWYHSHPGFGVFLSDHDLFIHENFFSARHQVAWVYDPHSDEEGCFGWENGTTRRLKQITVFAQPKDDVDVIRREPLPTITAPAKRDTAKNNAKKTSPQPVIRKNTLLLACSLMLCVAWLAGRRRLADRWHLVEVWQPWIDGGFALILLSASVLWIRRKRTLRPNDKQERAKPQAANAVVNKSEKSKTKPGV